MKTIAAVTAALLAAASAASGALAQDVAPPKTMVSYADLDLSQASGRAALEQRIEVGLARVCPQRPAPNELRLMQAYRNCRSQARAEAQAQLAQIYAGQAYAQAEVSLADKGK